MSSDPSEERESLAPIWARPAPGERKPTYSREGIVATAMAVADTDGFEAVSMRRIATEMGAGTMSLYHYVATKQELLALMGDAIMGELLVPEDELPAGWRDGMAAIARRTRDAFVRHPWILEHYWDDNDDSTGPNTLRHIEQSIAVASRTGLDFTRQFEVTSLVDDYVFGHLMRTRIPGSSDDAAHKKRMEAFAPYLEDLLSTGEFPQLEAFVGGDVRGAFARLAETAADDERFERGLTAVLDGIEAWVPASRSGRSRSTAARTRRGRSTRSR